MPASAARFAVALLGAYAGGAAALPAYTITDLGTLGGTPSWGRAVNNAGQVAGFSANTSGQPRAFIGDAVNGLTDLGTFGGSVSYGWGVNDTGQVTGYSTNASGQARAFIGDATNGLTDLGTLGGSWSHGRAVNDAGQVAGTSANGSGQWRAFIGDTTNGLTDLGTLGGSGSSGYGINDAGQVVGYSTNVDGQGRAFLWDPSEGMNDLNDLVDDLSGWRFLYYAEAISDTGYITGWGYKDSGASRAFLLTPLATPAPEPEPIAVSGLVRYEFQGTVSSVTSNLGAGVAVGDPFFATLSYNPAQVVGTDYGVEQVYDFAGPGAGYSLSVQVGSQFGGAEDGRVNILNNFSGGQDWFQTSSGPIHGFLGNDVTGLRWKQTTLTLKDYSGTLYDDTSLPNEIANLNNFEEAFASLFFDDNGLISAQIDRITAVITDAARTTLQAQTLTEVLAQNAIGGLAVELPAGTSGIFEAAFSKQAPSEVEGLPGNFIIPGDFYQSWELTFSGTVPQGEFVELIFHYSDSGMTESEELLLDIFRVVNGEFVALNGTVDINNNTITALTPGFSQFNLGLRSAGESVPEPGTLVLIGAGLAAASMRRRGRSRTKVA